MVTFMDSFPAVWPLWRPSSQQVLMMAWVFLGLVVNELIVKNQDGSRNEPSLRSIVSPDGAPQKTPKFAVAGKNYPHCHDLFNPDA